jgi:hypothetical protein
MARRPTTVDESARSALDCGGSTPPSLGQLAGRRTTTALLSRAGSPCHVAWPSWPYADWPNSRGQLAGRGSLFIRLKVKNGAASKLAGSKRRQSLPLSEAKGRRTPRRLRRTLFTDHFHDGEGAQGKLSENPALRLHCRKSPRRGSFPRMRKSTPSKLTWTRPLARG